MNRISIRSPKDLQKLCQDLKILTNSCWKCGSLKHKASDKSCIYAGQIFSGKICTNCDQGSHVPQKGIDCKNSRLEIRRQNSEILKKSTTTSRPPFRKRSMSNGTNNIGNAYKPRSQTPGAKQNFQQTRSRSQSRE